MKIRLKNYLSAKLESQTPADLIAFGYIVIAFSVLAVLTSGLGLYADDYWNLLEADKHPGLSYFTNHMAYINSRYTYALVNRMLYLLFYNPLEVFGAVYIRFSFLFVLVLHFTGVFFLYKSLARLGVPRTPLLLLLPFVCFPVYGHQALMWLGAAFAYPVGFALFSGATYALLLGRPVLFGTLTFLALGATEFVLLPSIATTFMVWITKLDDAESDSKKILSKKRIVRGLTLLAPFIAWALLVSLTDAAASRTGKIHGHPKLFAAPLKWAVAYFDVFLRRLQPEVWMQKTWYILPTLLAASIALIKENKHRLLVLLLASFYFLSIFPLSAVGYDFRPIRTARVWYLPGIFFYTALVAGFALALKRIPPPKDARRFRLAGLVAATAVVLALGVLFAVRMGRIAKDGEDAYGCIRGIIHTVELESNDKVPRRVEVCGFPPALYDFSIFRSGYAGPYALGLAFNIKRTIPLTRNEKCTKKKWGTPWHDPQCPYEARYKITF